MIRLQEQIANEVGITGKQVCRVLELFALETHRSFHEVRRDPIAELLWNSSPMAFFHFLGSLRNFAEMEGGEFHPEEYLLRMGVRADWEQFSDQMGGWTLPKDRP